MAAIARQAVQLAHTLGFNDCDMLVSPFMPAWIGRFPLETSLCQSAQWLPPRSIGRLAEVEAELRQQTTCRRVEPEARWSNNFQT
jgi:hypothetical protein